MPSWKVASAGSEYVQAVRMALSFQFWLDKVTTPFSFSLIGASTVPE